jgi:hypothetical protein
MLKTYHAVAAAALAFAAAGVMTLQASAENTPVPPPGGAPTFDAVDTNHDGTISKAEFQAFAAHTPHGPGGPGNRFFTHHMMPMDVKTLDKDGDGKVSFEEFAAPMKAHFAEMDANHDGFLQADEMPPPPRDGAAMPPAPPPPGN